VQRYNKIFIYQIKNKKKLAMAAYHSYIFHCGRQGEDTIMVNGKLG